MITNIAFIQTKSSLYIKLYIIYIYMYTHNMECDELKVVYKTLTYVYLLQIINTAPFCESLQGKLPGC